MNINVAAFTVTQKLYNAYFSLHYPGTLSGSYVNKIYHWFKETRSVTMNIFRKKTFLFKSFVKIDLSYVFTIYMLSIAENSTEK